MIGKQALQVKENGNLQECRDDKGIAFKRLARNHVKPDVFPVMQAKRMQGKASEDGINESFEGWDGTEAWMPEGWEKQVKDDCTWQFCDESMYMAPADGEYLAVIEYSTNEQDEWLITPEVTVKSGQILSFYAYYSPAFLFDMDYVDWDAYDFTEKHIAATLQIMVKADGGEWQLLKDVAEDYENMSLDEMLAADPYSLKEHTFSLEEYVGKNIKVGFRYVGINGNTMWLDAVSIGYPMLNASYTNPLGSLYWGMDTKFSALTVNVMMEPVFTPLTWTNTTNNVAASYSWYYHSPETNDMETFYGENLTQTYKTDYTSDFTTRNNMYFLPELTATAEGASDGVFKSPSATYFQAGGHADYVIDGVTKTYGLNTCSLNDGLTIMVVESEDLMKSGIPIFGYNEETAAWWAKYLQNGDEDVEITASVDGIFNFYYAVTPVVIDGLWLSAKGQVGENAEFKAAIYPLNDDFELAEEPIAEATCKGADIVVTEGGIQSYLALPFKFAEPVVVNGEDFSYYVVKVSGFNSPEVTYFAPCQSALPDPDGMCYGYLDLKMAFAGNEMRSTFYPIAYIEGDYGDCYNSFYMNLDAHYPWLEGEADVFEMDMAGGTRVFSLDSYYDASELNLSISALNGGAAPEWLQASVAGRYGETRLTLVADASDVERECLLTITAPGISRTFRVVQSASGIMSVGEDAGDAKVTGVYNTLGQKVDEKDMLDGHIYIFKYDNGKARKVVK